jgi:hypothetical protein
MIPAAIKANSRSLTRCWPLHVACKNGYSGQESLTRRIDQIKQTHILPKDTSFYSLFLPGLHSIPVKTEFHQIPSIDEIPLNSMEFHQPQFDKIQWNSMELNSMENSMECHEKLCEIPLNSMQFL